MSAAVFFDRDGTLNVEVGHVLEAARLELLPGAPEAVRAARAAGWKAVLVTNQSAIARGWVAAGEVAEANRRLAEACGGFDAVYVCPHHPAEGAPPLHAACACRKPLPGLLLRARDELGVDLARSWLIGDSASDLEAARAAGARAVLVLTGKGRRTLAGLAPGDGPDHVAPDVLAAVRWVIARAERAGTGRAAAEAAP